MSLISRSILFVVLAFAAWPGSADAQSFDTDEVSDQVAVLQVKNQIAAVDPRGGQPVTIDLRLDEEVVRTAGAGLVGLAVTDDRVLGYSAETGVWAAQDLRLGDRPIALPEFSRRLALVRTRQQVYVFNGRTGTWATLNLPPNEEVLATGVSRNVAVLVTNRRAHAFSAFTGGFFSETLFGGTPEFDLKVGDNTATVLEDGRLLTFGSRASRWTVTRSIKFN